MKVLIEYKNVAILFALMLMVAVVTPSFAMDGSEEDESEVTTAPTYETTSPTSEGSTDDSSDFGSVEEDD
jgi:hypothetical protein